MFCFFQTHQCFNRRISFFESCRRCRVWFQKEPTEPNVMVLFTVHCFILLYIHCIWCIATAIYAWPRKTYQRCHSRPPNTKHARNGIVACEWTPLRRQSTHVSFILQAKYFRIVLLPSIRFYFSYFYFIIIINSTLFFIFLLSYYHQLKLYSTMNYCW